jgi:hypothetical protein
MSSNIPGNVLVGRIWNPYEAVMEGKETDYFDLQTVALLRETLENAWACLRPEQRATMSRTLLAERILRSAAQGERDPERLLDAALDALSVGAV